MHAFLLVHAALGAVLQNPLYSDDMMLASGSSYDVRPFISGFTTSPGEAVNVTFMGRTYSTHSSATMNPPNTTVDCPSCRYNWEVQMNSCYGTVKGGRLAPLNETLVVKGTTNTLTYTNVACGQVYVCGGQSNMELPLSYVDAGEAIAQAFNYSASWRLFRVPHVARDAPQMSMPAVDSHTKLPAKWLVANKTLALAFSATCFLTARHVEEMIWNSAPFGLIWSSWGGTRVEAWTPDTKGAGCAATAPEPAPEGNAQLYNGMINPLTRYSLRGAFWYQGEDNVITHSSRAEYACAFKAMINQWRDAWTGIGDFAFIYAQLSAYTGVMNSGFGDISVIRLAQRDSLSHIGLDTTGMAVTFDLGDPTAPLGDVHSRHKDPVARRLALQALHVMYAYQEGETVTNHVAPQLSNNMTLHYSGPMLTAATMDASASSVTVSFDFGSGLHLNDTMGCKIHRGIGFNGRPIGGECCAAHDTFQLCTGDVTNTTMLGCVNATSVTLDSRAGTVTLGWGGTRRDESSDGPTTTPTSVRYAYANYPQCALYNEAELPASPFVATLDVLGVDAATARVTGTASVAGEAALIAPALTPPMGLNSWNAFHCNVDERKMRAMADALVSTGLKKAGYEFVNIDDCWQVERSPNGSINADPARFPGGIKSLADYVHSLGLKFGVYTAQREQTCQRRPGSWEHEAIDVQSYCDWGVDYLKIDQCQGQRYAALNTSWIKFRAAIDECSKRRGFPMVMSIESCDDPAACGTWVGSLANLWRTGGDIQAYFGSVLSNAAKNTRMAAVAGPTGGPLNGGHWNDPDMLQVGTIGLSLDEQRSHFALWNLMAAPLLIGADVSMLPAYALEILGNSEITAIDQDSRGVQGVPVGPFAAAGNQDCWAKPLANGDVAVVILNVGDAAATVTCLLADLGVTTAPTNVRDLWAHSNVTPLPKAGGSISARLESHANMFVRIST